MKISELKEAIANCHLHYPGHDGEVLLCVHNDTQYARVPFWCLDEAYPVCSKDLIIDWNRDNARVPEKGKGN